MAVENDKYELPICVETSAARLAERIGVKEGTVLAMEWRLRNRKLTDKGNRNKGGRPRKYLIVRVEEPEEEGQGD